MDNSVKEVLFGTYCPQCLHYKKKESEEPCDHCMDVHVRYGTAKPADFTPKSQKNQLL